MRKLTVGSCFSGIGGIELGLEWTGGFETKWQIENDSYAAAVLAKHWPEVKRYGDITTTGGGELERVDVICGGFPCQDVSFAGKRAGLKGTRTTLWSQITRLLCEIKPRWFVGENVPGLMSANDGRFFGNILRDLAGAGYDAEWGVLSAAGVGAPHLRKRVFILAHSMRGSGSSEFGVEQSERAEIFDSSRKRDVADAERNGLEKNADNVLLRDEAADSWNPRHARASGLSSEWWKAEPNVGRMASRVSFDVDRLRCLGNAVVPQVAQKVGEMILRYESTPTPTREGTK